MNKIMKLSPIIVLITMFVFSTPLKAQDDTTRRVIIHDHGSLTDAWAIFQGAKIRYITEHLEMTKEEKAGFWPLFHEYEREKKEIMSNIMEGPPGKGPHFIEKFSDAEVDSIIKSRLKEELGLINLKIKYYEKLREVLPPKKLARYYKLDGDFRKRLVERMRRKTGDGHERDRQER